MKRLLQYVTVVAVVLGLMFACSPGATEPGIETHDREGDPEWEGEQEPEPEPPEFLECIVVSETEIAFSFSAPVTVLSLTIEPELEIASVEAGRVVRVRLEKSFRPGVLFFADITAEDGRGNIIEAQASFEREAPRLVFIACDVVSETELAYTFSLPVQVVALSFDPALAIDSVSGGSTVTVYLEQAFRQGIRYTADILAEDEWGYSLNEKVAFTTDPPALVFLGARVVSETETAFSFSAPVTVLSLTIDPALEIASVTEGSTLTIALRENLAPGQRFTVDLLAEDEFGQTIGAQIPFTVINNRVPRLLINELRTEYSGTSLRAEYIEFKMLSAGNLGALRVFIASNTKNPQVYEFLPIEVAAGEYVVLHLRTLEDSSVDEYGAPDESGGRDSSPSARDFWIPGSAELLRKTDAVYVLDQRERVLDAVMISETADARWTKDHFAQTAEFLFGAGAWKSPAGGICGPADAVSGANIGSSITRSVSRDETAGDTNTAADWYTTANGGATPGLPNSPVRF